VDVHDLTAGIALGGLLAGRLLILTLAAADGLLTGRRRGSHIGCVVLVVVQFFLFVVIVFHLIFVGMSEALEFI
jgi:hypothetical protein